MTVSVIVAGLLPIMWSHRTGSEVMQRIAAPPLSPAKGSHAD
jgi:copper/silver efflux system protein